jgi:outer membrane protein assembly factor BamD
MRRIRTTVTVLLAAALLSTASPLLASKKKKPKPTPVPTAASKQPDKELYDKAMLNMKHSRLDVARLQLQALLNTYPESEYQMRAKLAIGDTWYKAGDSASLTQAENEYKDFITFFPTAPEAAQAQMRVADIYFKQMEKPDRDYQKTLRAEQEYRLMIQQFPDSPLVPEAKQKLREVQEVLAERQFEIAQYYATRANWPATIARYQTVIDTYPLYSKADLTLLGLGDAYMAEANMIRNIKGPEAIKSKLVKIYEDRATDNYDKILTRYPLEPHAVDAKQRLTALHRPLPNPTRAELAENQAEMESRAPVTLRSRALLLISRNPEILEASRVGEPDMDPPKPTLAPEITKQNVAIYNEVLHPGAAAGDAAATTSDAATTPATTPAGAPPRSDEAPKLEDVPTSGGGDSVGLSVVAPTSGSSTSSSPDSGPAPSSAPSSTPSATSATAPPTGEAAARGSEPASASVVSQPKGAALPSVGPKNTALPPVEKAADAPNQVNEVKNAGSTPTQSVAGKKKPKRTKEDKSDESSSKDKKKSGLGKLNPV